MLVISIAAVVGILRVGYMIAPGVDPYSEVYKFNVGSERVVNAVNNFKGENPLYSISEQIGLPDGLVEDSNTPDRMHGYIYYPKEEWIIHFWIRGDRKKSELHLVAVNQGLKLENWQTINSDIIQKG
ncbi:hypothetical protein [Pararcticibacter amylolyticus]|nr:hypothetical protein [Pararcticibacter amylolyticus]